LRLWIVDLVILVILVSFSNMLLSQDKRNEDIEDKDNMSSCIFCFECIIIHSKTISDTN
jgi:hypothetical protein